MAFSPDGKRIATGAQDDTVRVWNADGKGEPLVPPRLRFADQRGGVQPGWPAHRGRGGRHGGAGVDRSRGAPRHRRTLCRGRCPLTAAAASTPRRLQARRSTLAVRSLRRGSASCAES
nr:WD40 repeat domain-containing protein [Sorangium cellulosum]